jgi:tripartite-type tricarboxylate transporter receptor subunit TctC
MVATPEWKKEREKIGWEPVVKFGDDFDTYVKDELKRYKTLLKELGFLK